tara:strand:- start:599 stop:1171 length:573 start_codon:yes stop_codon:yes gene_type:complete
MSSFEDIARANVKALYPSAFAKNGVHKLIRGAYQDYLHWDDYDNRKIWFVPDGYFHFWSPDDEGGTDQFILIEIEDTNKLSIEKLCAYGQLWDEMVCNLRLWTFNRYGKFTAEHNLNYWWHQSIENSKKKIKEKKLLNEDHLSLLDFDKPIFPQNTKCSVDNTVWQVADVARKKHLLKTEKIRIKELNDY